MKVYILNSYDVDDYPCVMGVFSSYSAMLTWLDKTYGYNSKCLTDNLGGTFVNSLKINTRKFTLSYLTYDVIGEHSHKTNMISFD